MTHLETSNKAGESPGSDKKQPILAMKNSALPFALSSSSTMRLCTLGATIFTLSLFCQHLAGQECGQKRVVAQTLISNGYKALVGAWPWHGAMFHRTRKGTQYACGVTILTEQFVVTAAHCTFEAESRQRLPAKRVIVKVGVTNLDSPERHVEQHNVARIIRHEEFDDMTFEDDIALMELYTEITYNNYVQPICLWQGDTSLEKVVSQVGYVVGWGKTEHDEDYGFPSDLIEATMPIVSKKTCKNSDPNHYSKFYFESKTFCAGYRNGTSPAPGDSGGGLFLRVGRSWTLRGIVSNAKSDPNTLKVVANDYTIFTDASYYVSWMLKHVDIKITHTTESIAPTPFPKSPNNNQANLLNLSGCGKDSYKVGTPEELKGYPNQYPWLAVIEYVNLKTLLLEDVCHGVLIHPRFLVTAAHCVMKKTMSKLRSVRLNDNRLGTKTDINQTSGPNVPTSTELIAVVGISVHPNYKNPKYTNNIALVKLERPASSVPIYLPPKGSSPPSHTKFTIIGRKKNSRQEKPMIRNVVQLANFTECRGKFAMEGIPLDSTGGHVCSAYSHDDGDLESCSHYMGSAPLVYSMDSSLEGRYFLAAISSFGHSNCKRDDYPDVFTYVAHYSDWIVGKIKPNV